MSSAQARRDEILAKKAKLAELKRQREQRQKDLQTSRQSLDAAGQLSLSDAGSRAPSAAYRAANRADLDDLISSLVDRPSSSAGRSKGDPPASPGIGSRAVSEGDKNSTEQAPAVHTLGIAQIRTVYDAPAAPKREVDHYSKGVQTDDLPEYRAADVQTEDDGSRRERKRLSKLEFDRERDDQLRAQLRKEIEEELKAAQGEATDITAERYPARQLTDEELNAVTGSQDFLEFVERSTKVIERALEEDYDVLVDYAARGLELDDDDDAGAPRGRRGRRIKEVVQFRDEKWTKRRMLSDLDFSQRYPELLLASYTKATNSPHTPPGLAVVWNAHMPSRPEYTLTATSDLLCTRFSPFHPNIILGGTYSGQVCMWDTRQRAHDGGPVQRTPLAGEKGGHAHPVYSIDVVGTQNASNIVSVSTDGTVCAWSFDMLSKPQEQLQLFMPPGRSKTEDVAPTCIGFQRNDPTYFLAGTEQGSVIPVHRYDRAGAKAGIDQRVVYKGHTAPVTGLHFHPSRGKVDLGDLALTSAMDWSVKLWKVKPHGSAVAGGELTAEAPLLDIMREDVVYDVKWSPVKAGVFGLVDGAGRLEVFDLTLDTERPVSQAEPSHTKDEVFVAKSLNKLAWEHNEGRRVAVGGLDGVTTVFEVGADLGGSDSLAKSEEWMATKKLAGKLDRLRA